MEKREDKISEEQTEMEEEDVSGEVHKRGEEFAGRKNEKRKFFGR